MSLTSSVQRIVQAKADIKTAIEAKGVTVGDDVSIADYDDYIAQISGGGGGTLITKSITSNGTYDAEDDGADGYSSVTVNVQVEVPEVGSINYDPATFTLSWTAPVDESGLALLQQYGYSLFYKVVREATGNYTEKSLETTSLSANVYNLLIQNGSFTNTLKVLILLKTSTATTTQSETTIYPFSSESLGLIGLYLSSARRSVLAVRKNTQKVLLFGGFNYTNTIQEYQDYGSNFSITTVGTMPVAAYGQAGDRVGTDIYLFGGYTSAGALSTIYKYDTTTDTMTTLAATLPVAMMGMNAVAIGTNIFLFGGWKSGGLNNIIYKFDTTTETLTSTGYTIPTAAYDMGAAASGNVVYLFGGYNTTITPNHLNTIVKVDTSTWTITTLTSTLNSPIYGMGAVNLNGCIYAMGGACCNRTGSERWRR